MTTGQQKTLDIISSRLAQEFDPEKIFLFGSYAWGKPDENSDIDLMVIVSNSDLPPARRSSRAYRALRGIGQSKDIIVKTISEFNKYASVEASLEAKILKEGKLLYERSKN